VLLESLVITEFLFTRNAMDFWQHSREENTSENLICVWEKVAKQNQVVTIDIRKNILGGSALPK
jgi:hypothetical protein